MWVCAKVLPLKPWIVLFFHCLSESRQQSAPCGLNELVFCWAGTEQRQALTAALAEGH